MSELDQIVHDFATKLTNLLQQQMRLALGEAAATSGGNETHLKQRKPGRGEKRTAAEIQKLKTKVTKFIEDNEGKRIEEINTALGTITADLALPLRQLVAEKRIRTVGKRRGTKYFVK